MLKATSLDFILMRSFKIIDSNSKRLGFFGFFKFLYVAVVFGIMVDVACVAIEFLTYVRSFSFGTVMFIAQRAEFVVVANGVLVSFVAFQIFVDTRTRWANNFESRFKWALSKLHLTTVETFGL
jgi:hypothetical protein